jgi:DNA-binding NtrC family response regulator
MDTGFPEMQTESPVLSSGAELPFIVGVSRSMKGFERLIRELADSEVPVLLMSEPGAGKRATAEHIHQISARNAQPFFALVAGQVTTKTFDPTDFSGVFFNGGTVYLDEVAELNSECQESLLSLLTAVENDGNPFQRARLICGTCRDLEREVRDGRFREDLHYLISGLSLRLPPLRQRKEDILHLLRFFLGRYAAEFRSAVPTISSETERLFLEYSWPGNLRELDEAARVLVMMRDEALAMGGLRALLAKSEPHNGKRVSLKETAKAASREAEKELILKVLTRTRWNRRRAAEELQISYKALLYKLKQIGYGELEGAS